MLLLVKTKSSANERMSMFKDSNISPAFYFTLFIDLRNIGAPYFKKMLGFSFSLDVIVRSTFSFCSFLKDALMHCSMQL